MTPEEHRRLIFQRLLMVLCASGVLHVVSLAVRFTTGHYNHALLLSHTLLDTVIAVWGMRVLWRMWQQRGPR